MKTLRALLLLATLFAATLSPAATFNISKGRTVEFTVNAKGSAPLKYRWYRNGTQIAGTTVPRLVLRNIRIADSGSYTVVVFNVYGQTVSPAQVLVIKR